MLGINSRITTSYQKLIQPATISRPAFCGTDKSSCDRFESPNHKKITIFNPYTMEMCSDEVYFNRKTAHNVMLETKDKQGEKHLSILEYDPYTEGTLKDKKTEKDINTVILKYENPGNKNQFTYHIMSEDLSKEYGYICLAKHNGETKPKTCEHENTFFKYIKKHLSASEPQHRQNLYKDYENFGIEGERLEIEHIQNLYPKEVSGAGKIADKLAVKYCYDTQTRPNIVFYSMHNSHIENYKRGNRFLPLDKDSKTAEKFRRKYGTDDPNTIMETLINKKKLTKSETKSWGDLAMYMPSNIVKEHSGKYNHINMKIENPFKSGSYYSSDLHIDMSKERIFTLKNDSNMEITLKYDPKMKGHLVDKTTDEPLETYILKVNDDDYIGEDAFVFMSTDLKNEYGFVELDREYEDCMGDLECDYPEQGIRGDKLVVAYLLNKDKCKVGGVGKLADRVAVQYCKEHNINPRCIVSHAAEGSHVAHYKRGKRFIPPTKGDEDYKILKKRYGETNPNKILKRLIKESERNNEPVNIKGWGELDLVMFLPKEIIDKYSEEGIV